MGGGLTDWHRQKRKKEQKKNKEKRLAERDAKVLETKTVESVQDEIRKLERQHKVKQDEDGHDIPLPHAVKSKLDRLNKELKILKDSAQGDGDDSAPTSHKKKSSFKGNEWKPLDNPQLSVYYDPIMNPFGEPPPGQPRLYHTADGRTTFNLQEAALPGSRPPPPRPRRDPPPPESSVRARPRYHHHHQQQQHQQQQHQQHKQQVHGRNDSQRAKDPPPKSAGREAAATTQKVDEPGTSSTSSSAAAAAPVPKEPIPKAPPKVAPALPPPSQAVKRGRSRLKADIWASNEEIDYHQHVDPNDDTAHGDATGRSSHMTLEGAETRAGKVETFREWWYKDKQNQVQGPFPHEQILGWIKAGFFPPETLARPRVEAPWKPFHHYPIIRPALPGAQDNSAASTKEQEEEQSLQDRIAALKKQRPKTSSSVADRIAALRGDRPEQNEPSPPEQPDMTAHEMNELPPPPPPPPPPPSLPNQNEAEMPAYPVSYDASGTADDEVPETASDPLLPPLPPPPPAGVAPKLAPYSIQDVDDGGLPLPPPPPPPPPMGGATNDEVPAYALGDLSEYDGVDQYPNAYPAADYSGDEAYPAPDEDVPVTDSYPVVEAYPAMESADAVVQPPVKKAKIDREVVSFLPTNVQKRKK